VSAQRCSLVFGTESDNSISLMHPSRMVDFWDKDISFSTYSGLEVVNNAGALMVLEPYC
jgi:hypothetical protein